MKKSNFVSARIFARAKCRKALCFLLLLAILGMSPSLAPSFAADDRARSADEITASFRLIGAALSEEDADYGRETGGGAYVTWIATRTYTLDEGATVYDLFVKALADAGLSADGQENNYVKSITAPKVLGGYKLSEFTNGAYSGWMYTVDGKHPGWGLRERSLRDGEEVIFHYVNDYRYEVEDWFDDPSYPALGDGSHWNRWLLAEDKNPGGAERIDPKTQVLGAVFLTVLCRCVASAETAAALMRFAEAAGLQ
ncbi:MAG: DUF4430 domain-containing protein [Clostridiales Family XIII bacterium]|jgi:hypothetical protein|nr:DUF4430 domain-containing protein [Clostridiales Family XIII bacterium]